MTFAEPVEVPPPEKGPLLLSEGSRCRHCGRDIYRLDPEIAVLNDMLDEPWRHTMSDRVRCGI